VTRIEYGVDPDELLSHEIVIDKLDAAKRQGEMSCYDVLLRVRCRSAGHPD
jgi:hypothetical protein